MTPRVLLVVIKSTSFHPVLYLCSRESLTIGGVDLILKTGSDVV